ncbi:MAG: hypothetical protein Q9210_004493 [Variospora velana]
MSFSGYFAFGSISMDGVPHEDVVPESAKYSPSRGRTEVASYPVLSAEELSSHTSPLSSLASSLDLHASPDDTKDATDSAREQGGNTTMGDNGNSIGQMLALVNSDDRYANASLDTAAAGAGGLGESPSVHQPWYDTVSNIPPMDFSAHLGARLLNPYQGFPLAQGAPGKTLTGNHPHHEQPPATSTGEVLDSLGYRASAYQNSPQLQDTSLHHAGTQPVASQLPINRCRQLANELLSSERTVETDNLVENSKLDPGCQCSPAYNQSSFGQPSLDGTRPSTGLEVGFAGNKDRANPFSYHYTAPVLDSPFNPQSVPNASRKRPGPQLADEESTDPDTTGNKRKRISRAKPTISADPGGNKRACREIERIRSRLAQAIFELDPWDWSVEDVAFALTDKRSLNLISNPLLASLDQPLPSARGLEHTAFKLRDLVYQHNVSGRNLLARCDEAVLRRYGMAAGPQQSLLLSHVASLRRRSPGYGVFIRSAAGQARPVTDDLHKLHAYLRRFPLAEGQERSFGFTTHRWYVKNKRGMYVFSAQGRDGAVDALLAQSLMEMYPLQLSTGTHSSAFNVDT